MYSRTIYARTIYAQTMDAWALDAWAHNAVVPDTLVPEPERLDGARDGGVFDARIPEPRPLDRCANGVRSPCLCDWRSDHIRPGRRIAHMIGASGAARNSAITSKPWRA